MTCLGFAEVDKTGNVNASLVDGRIFGAGGFINISQAAKTVVFCGTLTAGGLRTELSAGHLRVVTEGKHHKFIDKVRQITFNAELARERGQEVLYVIERAVFVLGADGPVLAEVAPGWTAEQIIALMDFRPKLAEHIRPMSASRAAPSGRDVPAVRLGASASRIAPALMTRRGDLAQSGDIAVATDFRDGYLRHASYEPLVSSVVYFKTGFF